RGPRRQGGRENGRPGRLHPSRRNLQRPGARHHRRLGVRRTARRHETPLALYGAVLLLPWLARAGSGHRVHLQQESVRGAPGRSGRTLDHAVTAVQVYGLTDFHAKNAIALERLRTAFKRKVEVLPLPVSALRDLKKLSAEVLREESGKTPMARKAHASFTKFQLLVGPWDQVAEGAYHQLVAGGRPPKATDQVRPRRQHEDRQCAHADDPSNSSPAGRPSHRIAVLDERGPLRTHRP